MSTPVNSDIIKTRIMDVIVSMPTGVTFSEVLAITCLKRWPLRFYLAQLRDEGRIELHKSGSRAIYFLPGQLEVVLAHHFAQIAERQKHRERDRARAKREMNITLGKARRQKDDGPETPKIGVPRAEPVVKRAPASVWELGAHYGKS